MNHLEKNDHHYITLALCHSIVSNHDAPKEDEKVIDAIQAYPEYQTLRRWLLTIDGQATEDNVDARCKVIFTLAILGLGSRIKIDATDLETEEVA